MPYGCNHPNFVPLNFPQLKTGAPTEGADCGPASVAISLYLASCGAFGIGWADAFGHVNDKTYRGQLVTAIRQRGGMPSSGGTMPSTWKTAFNSYGPEFAAVGRTAPQGTYYKGVDFDSIIKPKLVSGSWMTFAGMYSYIDNYNNRELSGQWNLTAAHGMVAGDYQVVNGVESVMLIDPIADGRLSGSCNCIVNTSPDFPVPLSLIKQSMNAYSGGAKGHAMTFSASSSLVGTHEGSFSMNAILKGLRGGSFVMNASLVNPLEQAGINPDPHDPCRQIIGE